MHKSEQNQFMYLFIALRPLMKGFDFCRPLVVVNGAHLGGAYKELLYHQVYRKEDFDKLMAKVVKIDNRVKMYLEDADNEKWSRVHATVVQYTEFIYSMYAYGRRYIVCLERKIFNCGRFQLDEIPCAHTFAVLKKKNIIDIHPYCSDYYKSATLTNTYEVPMVPKSDKEIGQHWRLLWKKSSSHLDTKGWLNDQGK
ncbi:hypothetical protein H5410_050327 [Solanum commersonii]|uniref:SWIM-type domain-containing protein n=1 Tax=Solanum commersonii TaxID=4109 RepID=A0A9J5WX99_SOLCO|nr:hypothetical protein H5410_050327 [Solanum commersonii]